MKNGCADKSNHISNHPPQKLTLPGHKLLFKMAFQIQLKYHDQNCTESNEKCKAIKRRVSNLVSKKEINRGHQNDQKSVPDVIFQNHPIDYSNYNIKHYHQSKSPHNFMKGWILYIIHVGVTTTGLRQAR